MSLSFTIRATAVNNAMRPLFTALYKITHHARPLEMPVEGKVIESAMSRRPALTELYQGIHCCWKGLEISLCHVYAVDANSSTHDVYDVPRPSGLGDAKQCVKAWKTRKAWYPGDTTSHQGFGKSIERISEAGRNKLTTTFAYHNSTIIIRILTGCGFREENVRVRYYPSLTL